jgi:hypothetical protein
MPQPSHRPIASIDADLRSYCAFRRDIDSELAEVRRRQAELADLEASLVVTMEARRASADRLLEERLRASVTVEGTPSSVAHSGDLRTMPIDGQATVTSAPYRMQHAPQ